MGKKKTIKMGGIPIHSSAAEYLTYVAAVGDSVDSTKDSLKEIGNLSDK